MISEILNGQVFRSLLVSPVDERVHLTRPRAPHYVLVRLLSSFFFSTCTCRSISSNLFSQSSKNSFRSRQTSLALTSAAAGASERRRKACAATLAADPAAAAAAAAAAVAVAVTVAVGNYPVAVARRPRRKTTRTTTVQTASAAAAGAGTLVLAARRHPWLGVRHPRWVARPAWVVHLRRPVWPREAACLGLITLAHRTSRQLLVLVLLLVLITLTLA